MMNRDLSCNYLIPVEVPMSCNICDGMLTKTDCSICPTMWKEEVTVSEVEVEIDAPQSREIVTFILLKPCGFLTTFFFLPDPPYFPSLGSPLWPLFFLAFTCHTIKSDCFFGFSAQSSDLKLLDFLWFCVQFLKRKISESSMDW